MPTHLYIDTFRYVQTYKQILILVMPANNKENNSFRKTFSKNLFSFRTKVNA